MKIWKRKQNSCFYATIDGKQVMVGRTRKEAEAWLAAQRDDSTQAILTKYLAYVEKHRAARTLETAERFIKPFLATSPPTPIKPHHVNEWMDQQNWGSTTRNLACRTLKAAFNWATSEGYIDRSPIKHLKAPKAQRREVYLTEVQAEELLKKTKQPLKDLVEFIMQTGCRTFEARAIKTEHYRNGKIIFAKGKGGKQRVILLTQRADEIMQRLMKKYPTGHLFRNTRRVGWTRSALCQAMRKIPVDFSITAYGLRSVWATRAIERGVDIATVASLMGHANPSTLLQHYQNVAASEKHMRASLEKATQPTSQLPQTPTPIAQDTMSALIQVAGEFADQISSK